MPAWRGDSGTEPEALRRKRVVAWRVACNGEGALLIPEAQSTTGWGVQASPWFVNTEQEFRKKCLRDLGVLDLAIDPAWE